MSVLHLTVPDKESLIGVPEEGLTRFIEDNVGAKWQSFKTNVRKLRLQDGNQEEFAEELLRFLFLLAENTFDQVLFPSHLIETAWQSLLLDPVLYSEVSDLLLTLHGYTPALVPLRILPYIPASQIPTKEQASRYSNTLRTYSITFGTVPPPAIWPQKEKCSAVDMGFMSPQCISHIAIKNRAASTKPFATGSVSEKTGGTSTSLDTCTSDVCNMKSDIPLNSMVQVSVRAPFMEPILISVDQTVATVGYLKYELQRLIRMPAQQQVMYCQGRLLTDASILSSCTLANNCCIHVFYSLDNVRSFVNKNYFTKVVKLRSARTTSGENIHPIVSRISGNIVLRKKDKDPLLTAEEGHPMAHGLEEATSGPRVHYGPLVMANGL